jgi:hypothetical protein
MLNFIKNLLTPTYEITYAPEKSENDAAIQVYRVLGNPAKAGWRSSENKKLFTLPVANRRGEYRAFRCDRVLSVNFALV